MIRTILALLKHWFCSILPTEDLFISQKFVGTSKVSALLSILCVFPIMFYNTSIYRHPEVKSSSQNLMVSLDSLIDDTFSKASPADRSAQQGS